jgi:hypothetical protein
MSAAGAVEVHFHAFLTSVSCQLQDLVILPPPPPSRYSFYSCLAGLESWSRRSGEDKNLFLLPGI